jgi:hypothetical protein
MLILKKLWLPVFNFLIFIALLWILICVWGISKIDNVNADSIFTAFITFFIFGIGFFVKTLEERLKQLKKENQLKRVFICNLITIIDGLKLQIADFKKAIEKLKSSNPDDVIISSYAELDYFEINKISSEDLFKVFIDNLKGDESGKIKRLENLRKQLRFIENSQKYIFNDFEKLYNSFRKNGNQAIDGMKELGEYFDKEATRLLTSKVDVDNDAWFIQFSEILGEAHSVLRTSDVTVTDFTKLEVHIIPKFITFAKNNMEDPRTPTVTSIFNKTITSVFERKDTIRSLFNMLELYNNKYKDALTLIESTLLIYDK